MTTKVASFVFAAVFVVQANAFQIGSPVGNRATLSGSQVSEYCPNQRAMAGRIPLSMSDINPAVLEPKKKNLKTFQRYLEIECWKRAELRDLERVLQAVAESCKQINRIVQRAQTDDLYGAAVDKEGNKLDENVQGEVQQQLDVLCNTIMLRAFCGSSSAIHSVASEEEDEPRCCADVMVRSLKSYG